MHAGYTTALQHAREAFSRAAPHDMAVTSGAIWLADSRYLALSCLGDLYQVDYPRGMVRCNGREVGISQAILALHYLAGASGVALRQQFITFHELPGGEIYLEDFKKRTVALFLRLFAEEPERLWVAAGRLGGRRQGNKVSIPAFPRVPITLALWTGDDEVGPDGTVLYDASAPLYLPTEDLIVLASSTITALQQAGCDRT